jgi:MoxR-like ATPase
MKNQYTGKGLLAPQSIIRDEIEEKINPYIPESDLVKAVNLAILLKRPLLIMGQPGCGKSKLAQAVAYELYHQQRGNEITQDYRNFYFEWNIKSSSRAKDGLYEYDAIERLGDSQIKKADREAGREDLKKEAYIRDRPLGQAIKESEEDKPTILLIDEIDKADIDFPNDLLNEIDKGEYTITETNTVEKAKHQPIIFITSNAEKTLPDAFLRRCLFHYIQPLKKETLENIINRRFYKGVADTANAALATKVVERFIAIREELKKVIGEKNVSTSELLDWFEAIKFYSENSTATDSATQDLVKELELLDKDALAGIPFHQALFKNWNSLMYFEKKHKKLAKKDN